MVEKILKGPELTEVPNLTLGQFFFNTAEKFYNRTCQVDSNTGEHESYSSVKQRSTRVAIEMQKFGITSKDVIVLCSSVTLDTIIPIFASFYLGAKVANLDPSLSVRQTTHLLSLVSPKMIFVEQSALGLIEDSLKGADLRCSIVVFGASSKYSTFTYFERLQTNEEEFKPTIVNVHDVAMIFFSSGTTGLPKAICHSHYSVLHGTFSYFQSKAKFDVLLTFTTFYWISGILFLTCSFIGGGRKIICGAIEAEKTFRIIETHKVTCMFLAPILTYKLTNFCNYRDFDTSSLSAILTGGTEINPAQIIKLKAVFPHTNIVYNYGQTETFIVSGPSSTSDQGKIGSSGKLCPGFVIKIVDVQTSEILGPQQKGEMYVRSSSLMTGYFNNDSTQLFDEQGFLQTGDVCYYDEDGYLYFVGRIKEMFKYLSWHIVPSAIEAVLLEHPAVKEAVVFGLPENEEVGEVPAACVVLRNQNNASQKEIEEFVADQVSDNEKLRGGIFFRKVLSKSSTGKLMRGAIRDSVIAYLNDNKQL